MVTMGQSLGGLGPTVVIVMWLESVLAVLFTLARYASRTIMVNRLGWDDILMGVTVIFLTLFTIFCTIAATNGLGQHFEDLTREQFSEAYQWELLGQTFAVGAVATSKLAVGMFQLRIVETMWVRVLIGLMVSIMTVGCVFESIVDYVQCIPPDHIWNPTVPARCWMSLSVYVSFSEFLAAWTVVCDFAFAAIPWIVIWPLNMSWSRRAWICSSMSWGIFAGICGIVRAIDVSELNARTDYTYDTVALILWSSTETLVTVGTACIPTYRELYLRLFKPNELVNDTYRLDSATQREQEDGPSGESTPKVEDLRLAKAKDIESAPQVVLEDEQEQRSEHSGDPPSAIRSWMSVD